MAKSQNERMIELETWNANRVEIVTRGNIAKFAQNTELREFLRSTGETILVETVGRDVIWGIGLGKANEKSQDPRTWRGRNLLGFVLTAVRGHLNVDRAAKL